MKRMILAVAAVAGLATAVPAHADGLSDVEGARAHERQGDHLTRQEREKLRRYGGNDDGFYSGRRGYRNGYGYRTGPSVGVYVGPGYDGYGYGRPQYFGPYGY